MALAQTDVVPASTLYKQSASGIDGVLRACSMNVMSLSLQLCGLILQRCDTAPLSATNTCSLAGALSAYAKFCIGVCESRNNLASSSSLLQARIFVPPPSALAAEEDGVELNFRGLLERFLGMAHTMYWFMNSLPIEEVDWNSFMQVSVKTARKIESCLSSQTETVAMASELVTPHGSFDQDDSPGTKTPPDRVDTLNEVDWSPISHNRDGRNSSLSVSTVTIGKWIGNTKFVDGESLEAYI